MSSGFPPICLYPTNYDSDFTLFLVYNTAEAKTTEDVDPWAEEIPLRPRTVGQDEIWADNGFANLAGELFYYDAVQKNTSGKVCRLKRCVRNLGGKTTQFNQIGTWVRGFVVSEHHNQLVDAALLIENFVGENFSINPVTLDWRIRHLADSPIQGDDVCPECNFTFEIVSTNSATGTIARYDVEINGNGTFVLQFGDGTSTSASGSGIHVYAPGATIDPVLVVSSDLCQIVQSPIISNNPQSPLPPLPINPPFVVPVPVPPPMPSVNIPRIVVPGPTTNIPPIVFPSVNPRGIPSVIQVRPPINIPSFINITPIPSSISIIPPIRVPSRILGPNIHIPSHIQIQGPNTIQIAPPPPIPPIQISPPLIPPIRFAPGSAEVIPSVIRLDAPSQISVRSDIPSVIDVRGLPSHISVVGGGMSLIHNLPNTLRFEPIPKLEFDQESIRGVMTQIHERLIDAVKVTLPDFNNMPKVQMDWGEIPSIKAFLKLQQTQQGLLDGGPTEIDFPGEIKLVHDLPESIALKAPKLEFDLEPLKSFSIPVKVPSPEDMPAFKVEMPKQAIRLEFPSVIPNMKIEVPDNTRIPLIYSGPPIPMEPVQINVRIHNLAGEAAQNVDCFALVPCNRK
jgi:hypothetical protein